MKLRYDNITISGGVAVGSTTLLEYLRPVLEPEGFTLTSTGNIYREMLRDMNKYNKKKPLAEFASADLHRKLDKKVCSKLKKGTHHVIEGWLAGFMARDMKHTLRVFVFMSDDHKRARRLARRENIKPQEALDLIYEREMKNFTYWKSLYGNYDFWDPKYYNLALDTSLLGKTEARNAVLDAMGFQNASVK